VHSRHFLTSCLAIGLTLFAISGAFAQQSNRKPVSTKSQNQKTQAEQAARVRWQPTRPQSGANATGSQVQQAAHQVPPRGIIRRTQGNGDLPAPPQPKPLPQADAGGAMRDVPLVDLGGEGYEVPMQGERSVMNGGSTSGQHLDGEIVYDSEPYLSESYAGGAEGGYSHGSGGCSCGASGCDGGSCDSMGCSGHSACGCNACSANAWRPCFTLCFPQDGWASFEYLSWNQRGMSLPALVTQSRVPTPRANAGVLDLNTTDVLFGGNKVLDNGFDGGRLQFGVWLDKCHLWGIGAEYFQLSEQSESFRQNSTGNPILARPFFNVLTGRNDAELVAFNDPTTNTAISGTVTAEATSQLTGAGFHLRRQMNSYSGCGREWLCGGTSMIQSRTDLLMGYRYLQLDESVRINENLVSAGNDPGLFVIDDSFETLNQFNGVDLGILYNRRRGLWSLDLLGKLALGNTHQVVDINGTTRIGGAAAQTGGLLAQTSNIGRHERDRFSFVPELGATAGYYLTRNLKLKAGYTVIFWSSVVRPGDQIDLDVNPNFLPPVAVPFAGAQRPGFQFDDSDYYVHGVNLGAELTW